MKPSMKLRRGMTIFATFALALLIGAGGGHPAFGGAGSRATGTTLRVSQMAVNFFNSGGPKRTAVAYVWIVDEYNAPVDGALVTGDWSGCFRENGGSATTTTTYNSDGTVRDAGLARIQANRQYSCWGAKLACNFTFTVTSVAATGYTYVPTANTPSSASAGTICR